jgi:glycosyltransferase involved in cell wall biosynthesis
MESLLATLADQTHQNFELIVVDQNPDDRLVPILEHYRTQLRIVRVRSKPGVSLARNAGLRHATGDVVGFPDDDCWYLPQLLEQSFKLLRDHPEIDGVTGCVKDERGIDFARFDRVPGLLTLSNIWQRVAGACLFLRKHVVEEVGDFDESLGPNSGTIWGGAEDIDYPVRAIKAGFKIYYDPGLVVFHPNPLRNGYGKMVGRAYTYGAGIGRVWRKHDYPARVVIYYLARPLGGALLSLATGRLDKARYHWSSLRGRFRGWWFRN